MPLAELTVQDLRCVERAEFTFGPGTHVIYGANGAGKTTVLEAIFLLGRGRSFRTRFSERLIRLGQPWARVVGTFEPVRPAHTVGLEVRRPTEEGSGTIARIDGGPVNSLADLARAFPVQVLDPEAHQLIEGAPARRRRWFDWGVFHVEPGFGTHWSRYQRALQQRNAALRRGGGDESAWDRELAREGEAMTAARERVRAQLEPFWQEASAELVGLELSLGFQAGWAREADLESALGAALGRDRERRVTSVGPHRADWVLKAHGKPARDVLSRGQQKLAAIALHLAQLAALQQGLGLKPTVLLDDPAAELDADRLAVFMRRIQALETQIIVTSLTPETPYLGSPDQVFHVEQGRVDRV